MKPPALLPCCVHAMRLLAVYAAALQHKIQVHFTLLCDAILQRSIALPDVHSGYGFAIGNVAAFDMDHPEVRPLAVIPVLG